MIDNKVNEYKQYSENDIRENYRKLTRLLIAKELTITTMESATSGCLRAHLSPTAMRQRLCREFRRRS